MFDKYLASWRTHKLSQIRRSEVIALHLRLKEESGPYTANRVLRLSRAMFNWAIHPDSQVVVRPESSIEDCSLCRERAR